MPPLSEESCPFYSKTRQEVEILINDMVERRLLSRELTRKEIDEFSSLFESVAKAAITNKAALDLLVQQYKVDRAVEVAREEVKKSLEKQSVETSIKWSNIAKIAGEILVAVCAIAAFVKTFI